MKSSALLPSNLPSVIDRSNLSPSRFASQRLCNFCNENTVEDETHFILHCDLYSDIRYELYEKATKVCCNFILLNDKEKMCILMNNVNLQHDVAKTLYAMFNRRKMFL